MKVIFGRKNLQDVISKAFLGTVHTCLLWIILCNQSFNDTTCQVANVAFGIFVSSNSSWKKVLQID